MNRPFSVKTNPSEPVRDNLEHLRGDITSCSFEGNLPLLFDYDLEDYGGDDDDNE